jgi:TRAP-type uncharacterized transport system substrate-binding protein
MSAFGSKADINNCQSDVRNPALQRAPDLKLANQVCCLSHHGGLRLREVAMLGFSRWQIFKTSAAAVLAVGTISLLLIYFIPAPPSTVTMATGNKGTTFEYFGQRYRDIFARSHVELKVRETGGALDNIELLKNPNSGVQIGLAFGGISDGKPAPGVLSLGIVYTNPFWIFYSLDEPLDRLSQL